MDKHTYTHKIKHKHPHTRKHRQREFEWGVGTKGVWWQDDCVRGRDTWEDRGDRRSVEGGGAQEDCVTVDAKVSQLCKTWHQSRRSTRLRPHEHVRQRPTARTYLILPTSVPTPSWSNDSPRYDTSSTTFRADPAALSRACPLVCRGSPTDPSPPLLPPRSPVIAQLHNYDEHTCCVACTMWWSYRPESKCCIFCNDSYIGHATGLCHGRCNTRPRRDVHHHEMKIHPFGLDCQPANHLGSYVEG